MVFAGFASQTTLDIVWGDSGELLGSVKTNSSGGAGKTVALPVSAKVGQRPIVGREQRANGASATGMVEIVKRVLRNVEDVFPWDDIYCEDCSSGVCREVSNCGNPPHDAPSKQMIKGSRALRLNHNGGSSYANVMYAFQIRTNTEPSIDYADTFELDLRFLYKPDMPLDNAGGKLTRMQAVEFGVRLSKLNALWDWETQWNLIPNGTGGTPEWNVLLERQWIDRGPATQRHLAANTWHHVVLRGRVASPTTYAYEGVSVNGDWQPITDSSSVGPNPWNETVVTVITQLDGPNALAENGFEVFLDQVTVSWWRA